MPRPYSWANNNRKLRVPYKHDEIVNIILKILENRPINLYNLPSFVEEKMMRNQKLVSSNSCGNSSITTGFITVGTLALWAGAYVEKETRYYNDE